ncbi:MAG: RNA-binding protein [Synechococcales cyanobacterium RM1_1_8]|nr:RNA-binding protein [Synechococcales cyanobacterium RM1_1_8]
MSTRLYVGNLPNELENPELEAVFAEAGEGVSTKIVTDRKTGKCRGFGFVTVEDDSQADAIIEKYNGFSLKGSEIKVEKAQPRAAGTGESSAGAAEDGGGSRKRKDSGKTKRRSGGSPAVAASTSTDNLQPDPRWAGELEKLKAMLAQNS